MMSNVGESGKAKGTPERKLRAARIRSAPQRRNTGATKAHFRVSGMGSANCGPLTCAKQAHFRDSGMGSATRGPLNGF